MSGSFWKFSTGFTSLSKISTLLEDYAIKKEQGDVSRAKSFSVLLKLLDENDLLQELLSNNSMLLEFLRDKEVLGLLVDLVIHDGMIDEDLSRDLSKLNLHQDEKDTEMKSEKEVNDITHQTEYSDVSDDRQNEEEHSQSRSNLNSLQDSTSEDSSDHSVVQSGSQETDFEDSEKSESHNVDEKDVDDDVDSGSGDNYNLDYESDEKNDGSEDNEDDVEGEDASRRATIASEILSADVWSLTDTVMDSTESLDNLWSILDSAAPLSLSLSTYFMKIMEHLLDMKCDEMINYLVDNQPNLVEKFMKHLSNPPLMDFLLKLISTDKPDNSTGIIDFLQRQNLISLLIEALDISNKTEEDPEILLVKQSSAADFLKALITISANSTTENSNIGPNELTRELVSYEKMDRLCNIMLKGGYTLANGVGIVIEIIRKNNSDYDILPVLYITLESHPPTSRDSIYLGHLLKIFGLNLDKFTKLLESDRNGKSLETPFGEIEPLGFERFKICELVAELLHCSNMALLNDNKGYEVVKERDDLREKMKEFDPVSFKYNEVITLPDSENKGEANYANDTIESFNADIQDDDGESLIQSSHDNDEEIPHANANLTEEQIRANSVIGDYLKIALYDNQIVTKIVSMFYAFPWNNFLHNVVFDIVQQVLNGSMDIGFNKFLAIDMFELGDITNKIIEGQEMCEEYERTHNGLRLGYMGHLTLIAEEVVKFIQVYPVGSLSNTIDKKVQEKAWEDYVNQVLYDTREKYNAILGGGDEEDDEMSNTFDEGTGDLIDNNGFKSGLKLDPSVDHDILGSDFDEQASEDFGSGNDSDGSDDDFEDPAGNLSKRKSRFSSKLCSSDESESEEDDDHFTNYMSQQLTNTASTEIVSAVDSPNELDNEKENSSETSQTRERYRKNFQNNDDSINTNDDDGFDEYIDPNDDGLSYKKPNSLYDAKGSLINMDDELSSEDSSSSSGDDDEFQDDKSDSLTTKNGNQLTRSASKGS